MQRREFLQNGLLLGLIGLPGIGGLSSSIVKSALPTMTDSESFGLLLDAVRLERVDVIKSLVHRGANIKAKGAFCNQSHSTLLHYAAAFRTNSNIEVLKCLVTLGIDIDATDNSGNTPLHRAVWNGNENVVEVIKFLVSNGAVPDVKNKDGDTPLDLARKQNDTAVVEYLSNMVDCQA